MVLFDNLGPYHLARLRSCAQRFDVCAVQVVAKSTEYLWETSSNPSSLKIETLGSQAIEEVLERVRPILVAIPGWSSRTAMAACRWCVGRRIPVIIMADSTRIDAPRKFHTEFVKSRYVRLASAALVAGSRHQAYLAELGMPVESIVQGYDVVDNAHFLNGASEARRNAATIREHLGLPSRYFLASNRFVEKKNLFRLLEAYADYRLKVGSGAWSLVLLGDGPLRQKLLDRIAELGINPHVKLPGFVQYGDLPKYYGLASAFVHASTVEQWGLVVNEAMASGLPVVVSERCGCAPDLVFNARNGWTFDPFDVKQLAQCMARLTQLPESECTAMGRASQQIISNWDVDRFATGLHAASEIAFRTEQKRMSTFDRLAIHAMSRLAR